MYNNGMNNVDIADQLQGTYRLDRWMRKCRWWWSIWMWGLQVLLVNAYVLYQTAHSLIWKTDKKFILSQYQFREEIIKSWMDGKEEEHESHKRRKLSETQVTSFHSSASSEVMMGRTRSSTSSTYISTSDSNQAVRGRKVNDGSLDSTSGDLRMRLDADFHYPIPLPKNKYPPCSLCRWALKDGSSRDNRVQGASVSTCDKCNVYLCLACYKPFHTIMDVEKLRSEVRKNHAAKD